MSSFINQFYINGVIDTSRPVLQNIEEICTAASCWMTWDPSAAQWSVVINGTGPSVASFDDNSIVGSLNVSGSAIENQYNSIAVSFPNADLEDTRDTVELSLREDSGSIYYLRYENELDNRKELSLDIVNNSLQAQLIASRELKQSRLDKVVEFITDFSRIGLKAGDIIDITASMYGFNKKLFRIISIEEEDADTGEINLRITALEYDAGMYTTDNLTRKVRSKKTGIIPKAANSDLTALDLQANGSAFANSMNNPQALALIMAALNGAGIPKVETVSANISVGVCQNVFGEGNVGRQFNRFTYETSPGSREYTDGIRTHAPAVTIGPWTTNGSIENMTIAFTGPQGDYDYKVDSGTKSIVAGIPCLFSLFVSTSPTGPWTFGGERYLEWSTYTTNFNVRDIPNAQLYWFAMVTPFNTYDLSATDNYIEIDSVTTVFPGSDGDAFPGEDPSSLAAAQAVVMVYYI